jgi:hypothetical protein
MATSPAPASSNGACGFPALRFPDDFTPGVMRPLGRQRFRDRRPVPTPPGPAEVGLRPGIDPLPQVLQIAGAFIISPLPPFNGRGMSSAGPLRSTDVTPLPRYYPPFRHPLAFGRLPGVTGYTASLAPSISRRGEEGFSSCSARPGHHAVALTPPEESAASASLRRTLLPSPSGCGLGLRGFALSGPPLRSLVLRPGDSLTLPRRAWSMGFRTVGFPPACHPSYGASGSCPGGTDSH